MFFLRKQLQNSVQKLSQTSHNLKNHFSRMKCFLKESLFALGNPDVTNHHSIMGNNQIKNYPNPAHYFDHNFAISHIFSKYFSPLRYYQQYVCVCGLLQKQGICNSIDGHWLRNPQSIQQLMTTPSFIPKEFPITQSS